MKYKLLEIKKSAITHKYRFSVSEDGKDRECAETTPNLWGFYYVPTETDTNIAKTQLVNMMVAARQKEITRIQKEIEDLTGLLN